MKRKVWKLPIKLLTVSNLTRKIVIEKYGISPEKVVTVYNAVEPLQPVIRELHLKKGADEKIVTFLGRITMQKGSGIFCRSRKKVLEKMDNVRFVMAGSGDMMNRIIAAGGRNWELATNFILRAF